ncbi:MAG TPA: TetR family transcriptional regulator, partial [Candidatus Dormibacteraeota bacterium]
IQAAAFELFAERGYRETTISAIADRADVAPRTVTVHFPTKEELLFDAEPFTLESLVAALDARGPQQSALDALADWMASTMNELGTEDAEPNNRVWERRALRAHIINAEPELRGRARAGYHEFEQAVADAIGQDLGQPGTALVPRLAALTAVTGLRELYETDEARALPSPPTAAGLLALVDRVIAFTGGGIDASTATPTSRRKTPASLTAPEQRRRHLRL